ncbi:hypothetical protein [Pseudomonas mandelii]|uniref:Uncharacterized protein n=1 Tax=Pseudomonas mandelii TaxID=75612 RepID=A0ABY0VVL0_9PSED|nr:hypothetical protein [Pseudomonas mandelii]TWS07957.1 hypothetical protein FJD35_23910 [Pseudomonas mandelii]SDU58486.1 hypothetical protein SAMN04489801_4731 [Pseudomonas mandelii]
MNRSMNKMEEEVVYLLAVIELIRSMVNYEIMMVVGEVDEQSIQFKSMTHKQFFSIALVDFLSQTDTKAPVPSTSYLGALRAISAKPSFNVNGSVQCLKDAVIAFTEWLRTEIDVDAWLGSISLQVKIRIPRYLVLKIDGNISKHNTLRSVGVAEELQRLLKKADKPVELYEAMLAQKDIYDIFHDDISAYHASTIAEFLNNVHWGIQRYLKPEFARSFAPEGGDSPFYRFLPPDQLEHPYAKTCYWSLMNQIRSEPIFKPFTVTRHLKGNY